MFAYLRTKESFLEDCKKLEDKNFFDTMKYFIENNMRYKENGNSVEKEEQNSWKNTFNNLKIIVERLNYNIQIGLEYVFSQDYRRIDAMIGGIDSKGNKKIFIFEIKQWDAEWCNKNKNMVKTKNPFSQLSEYCSELHTRNTEINSGNIELIPIVWLFNLDTEKLDKDLKDFFEQERSSNISFFSKNKYNDIVDLINEKLDYEDVFSTLKKGEPCSSFCLHENVQNILDGSYEICLKDDQKAVFNHICKKIEDTQFSETWVHGSSGSGKSIVAFALFHKFLEEGKTVLFCVPEKAPFTEYIFGIDDKYKHFFSKVSDMDKIINELNQTIDVIILDEAHSLYNTYYRKKECNDISKKCNHLICFYDEQQRVEDDHFPMNKNKADYTLNSQFRCNQDDGYISFINDILYNQNIFPFNADSLDFDVKLIKDENIDALIKDNDNTDIFVSPFFDKLDEIKYGTRPNYKWFNDIRGLETPHTIVIIKKEDLSYDTKSKKVKSKDDFNRNKIYILLTRGMKSCSIYCEDEALREYLHKEKGIKWTI